MILVVNVLPRALGLWQLVRQGREGSQRVGVAGKQHSVLGAHGETPWELPRGQRRCPAHCQPSPPLLPLGTPR